MHSFQLWAVSLSTHPSSAELKSPRRGRLPLSHPGPRLNIELQLLSLTCPLPFHVALIVQLPDSAAHAEAHLPLVPNKLVWVENHFNDPLRSGDRCGGTLTLNAITKMSLPPMHSPLLSRTLLG